MTPDISPLLTPITIGPLTIPTRFVLPPMERGWFDEGKPLPRLDDYYAERVRNGIGLIIVETTEVDDRATETKDHAVAARMKESTLEAWSRCVEAVHAAGGKIFVQLNHRGAFRFDDEEHRSVSPSGMLGPGLPNGIAAADADLQRLREAYARSADVARRAGFDGIEIQAAHSYLLDQFMWAQSNRREDGYGGDDIRDRVRFPAEVVAAVREAMGPDLVLSYRFSQYKPIDFAARVFRTPEELGIVLDTLRAAGVDVVHASALRFDEPAWPDSDLSLAGWAKSLTDAPVITVGSVGLDQDVWSSFFTDRSLRNSGPEPIEDLLRRFDANEFDLVAVGRAVMADPEWVTKVRDGRYGEIRPFDVKEDLSDVNMDDMRGFAQPILDAFQKYSQELASR